MELLIAPVVRVENLFVGPNCETGELVRAICATRRKSLCGALAFTVAPAAAGETLHCASVDRPLPPGDSLIETELKVDQSSALWN